MLTRLCDSVAFKNLPSEFKCPGAARVDNIFGAKVEQALLVILKKKILLVFFLV